MKDGIWDRTAEEATGLSESEFKRQLLTTLGAIRDEDFSSRLRSDWTGLNGKMTDTANQIASRMQRFNTNVVRLRNAVGEEGQLVNRLTLGDSVGDWAERIEAINALVDDLSLPTEEMGRG